MEEVDLTGGVGVGMEGCDENFRGGGRLGWWGCLSKILCIF